MKVLVTGGAGFIGSHLARTLCERGARVLVLDNLSQGKLDNLSWRQPWHDLEFVPGDVGNATLVRELAKGCKWVFHHAARVSVPLSVAQPVETNQDNLTATLTLLTAARDAGVSRFVFASSSAVYGAIDAPSKHEGMPTDPLTPYAVQKCASELYCRLFYKLYGLETVCLRYFNVFGPRQPFGSPYSGVIARFCTAMLRGQPPTIFGDGRQSRDFIYVENVVAANLLAVERPSELVAGRVFNVGCGKSVNLLELVAELNRLTGSSLEPQFQEPRAGDVRFSEADMSAARTDLGFNPAVSWATGIEKTLDFYRQTQIPTTS